MSGRSVEELDRIASELLPEIAAGAAQREADRLLPYEQMQALAQAGLGTYRVPACDGGAGATARQSFRFVIDLATADANVAQALRPHLGFVEGLRQSSDQADRDRWVPEVLAGRLFGLANGEVGAPNGVLRTRATPEGDHFRINGTKFYSTGCLFSDWISVSALDEDGRRVSFVVPSDREGVTRVDDWDGIGQRLTASGTTTFDNVLAWPHEQRRADAAANGPRSLITATQQLVLASVEVGIAHNALADAVDFARLRARPIKHSAAARSVDDPHVQHVVGEISARAHSADAAVLAAADAIDAALAAQGEAAVDLAVTASVSVAQAQFIAAETGLRAGELLFDVGGGSTTERKHNLDRHWRNARTVANHNPRAYKASVVGAYRLTGQPPPTTGLF